MSFGISLSGLDAASSDLNVISNNIANSGTTGYKSSRANFADVYAQGANLSSNQVGEGVEVQAIQQQFTQGSISQTGNSMDLALNGNGFFVVKDGSGVAYTRNGTFSVNAQGYLVNGSGQKVQAYPALPAVGGVPGGFNTGAPQGILLPTTMNIPQPTTTGTVAVNLPASSPIPGVTFDPTKPNTYNSTTSTAVYDSLGTQHTASFYFVPATTPAAGAAAGVASTWNVYLSVDGTTVNQATPGTLSFNSSGGLVSAAGGATNGQLNFTDNGLTNGAAPLSMDFDFSKTTQFGSPFGVNSLTQNGYASGQMSGVSIDASGVVSATYSNGQTTPVAQLAIANFPNSNGLVPTGNSNWKQTYASGAPVEGVAGTSNLGTIQSGSLESSNVNLTQELVSMIVAQRAFQANAEAIKTNDQITQTAIAIKQG